MSNSPAKTALLGVAIVAAMALNTSGLAAQRLGGQRIGVAAPDASLPRRIQRDKDARSVVEAARGQPAPAQRFFVPGDWYLSPRVWLGGVEEGATAYGATIERAISDPDSDEDGVWALGASFDYYQYNVASVVDVSVMPIGAVVSYHVALENPRIDPYVGAGLGYFIVSASGGGYGARASTVFFQSQLGARYFLTDAAAIGAHIGTGIGSLAISGTLRF